MPTEMVVPVMAAGIKKPDLLTRLRVYAGQVRALVAVTREASQRKIAFDPSTTVLLSDYVLNLKGKFVELLWHLAIFATAVCPVPDVLLKGRRHGSGARVIFFQRVPGL